MIQNRTNNEFVARHQPRIGEINPGDRVFVRVIRNNKVILEFVSQQLSNMTELLGTVRRKCADVCGLVRISLRNQTLGWSQDRPLMLYNALRRPQPTAPAIRNKYLPHTASL